MEEKARTRGWNKNPLNHQTFENGWQQRAKTEHHFLHLYQNLKLTSPQNFCKYKVNWFANWTKSFKITRQSHFTAKTENCHSCCPDSRGPCCAKASVPQVQVNWWNCPHLQGHWPHHTVCSPAVWSDARPRHQTPLPSEWALPPSSRPKGDSKGQYILCTGGAQRLAAWTTAI